MVGSLEYNVGFLQAISSANESIASLIRSSLFLKVQRVEYEILDYMDSIEDWDSYLEKEREYYMPPDEAMIETIHSMLSNSPGEIVTREAMEVTLLRRPS